MSATTPATTDTALAERLAKLSPAQRELLARRLAGQGAAAVPVEPVARHTAPGTPLPLSSAQQRIWLFEKITPGTGAYHVYGHYFLDGALVPAALERAGAELVRRHHALRTAFDEVAGEPRQTVLAACAFTMERVDLTGLPEAERESEARRIADLETERPFDLGRPPLLRLVLIALTPTRHLLLSVVHHIVADAWSRGVLFDELVALYAAYARGAESPLAEPAVQMSDAVLWQRREAYERRVEGQLAWWRETLDGVGGVLELPTDRPRPAVAGGRGARHAFSLPTSLVEAIDTFARQQGATRFMLLLAAFQVLLARWSGQSEIVVGSPVANREPQEFESAVGLFVNTLALRGEVDAGATFRQLLADTRRRVLGALDHAQAPLERVVEDLALARVPGRPPLFQVMFVLQNADGAAPQLPGLVATWHEPGAQTARFEITLSLGVGRDGIDAVLDYDRDLHDAAAIARLADAYARLLGAALATPEQPLARLPLLSEAARAELLALGDGGAAIVGAESCLAALLPAAAARAPEAIALIEPGAAFSYRQLHFRVNGLAHLLVGRGPRIAVLADRSAEAVIGVLGVLAAGAAYVPLDPASPPERLRALLVDCGAAAVVAPPALVALARSFAGAIAVIASDQAPPTAVGPSIADDADAPAYVIYTSGSTGAPKGVVVPQRGAMNMTRGFVARHDLAGRRLLMIPPLIFDASVGDLFPVLAVGATLVLHPNPAALGPRELAEYCREHAIDAIDAPAALWRRWSEGLAREGANALPSLAVMMIGGESVPLAEVRRFARLTGGRVALSNHYGPTEASVCATMLTTRDAGELDGVELPIGRPLPGVRLYVLDDAGELAPRGVVGELAIGGVGVADGYLGAPQLTAERFLRDPFVAAADARIYRTGDRVRWNADGTLSFLGRRDFQAKLRGIRIELGEIETALAAHPEVRAAAVALREDRPGDKRLVAYVVAASDEVADATLRGWLAARLPEAMLPSLFVRLAALPLSPNGKVDRRALPVPPAAPRDLRQLRAPTTATEQAVLAVWRELLGRADIGVDEDYFALGGDSLSTLPLLFKLNTALGTELPLAALFAAPTVAGMAEAADRQRAGEAGTALDLAALVQLPVEIDPRHAAPADAPRNAPRQLLLTGATGFLGAYLLRELLDRTAATIHCLVRADEGADALGRVRDNLRAYGLWHPDDAARLRPVRGELALPRLGLDGAGFDALAETVDAIFHNGGQVNFLAPYARLEAANVGGTREVLRLATRGRLKPVHLVSTLGVHLTADNLGRTVRESDPAPEAAGQHGGYNQSKWVAEQLALVARERGLPLTLHRPARITGDSRSGASNVGDYFNAWIRGCVQLGLAPRLPDEAFDMMPVDVVARGLVTIALGEGVGNYHYFNPRRLPIPDAIAAMRDFGLAVREVPYADWRRALIAAVAAKQDNALAAFAGMFPERPDPREPEFDCSATFAAGGIDCPAADRALFASYLRHLETRGQFEENRR